MKLGRGLVGSAAVLGALAGPGTALHPDDADAQDEEEVSEGAVPGLQGGGEAVNPHGPGVVPEDESSADADTVDGNPGEVAPEQIGPAPGGAGAPQAPAPQAPAPQAPAPVAPVAPPAPIAPPPAVPPPQSGLQAPDSVPGMSWGSPSSSHPGPSATRDLSMAVPAKPSLRPDPRRPATKPRTLSPEPDRTVSRSPRSGAASAGSVGTPVASKAADTSGSTYLVRAGDSLWSIARERLAPGASAAQIAREVDRLWRLNAPRIGSGDPSQIQVGTRLTLD